MAKHKRRTVSDTLHVLVREDAILMEVRKATSLLDESRRQAMCVGLVVRELRVNEVVDLS